jgi:hypothetical protein
VNALPFWTPCDFDDGMGFACNSYREDVMVPIVSVIGCLLIAFGVLGSAVALGKDRPR